MAEYSGTHLERMRQENHKAKLDHIFSCLKIKLNNRQKVKP
jgi:hypothetical protein